MHDDHIIRIARELLLCGLAAVVLIFLIGSADKQRKAVIHGDGRVEFAPNRRAYWAWPVLVVYLAYASIRQLEYSHGRLLEIVISAGLGILALIFLFSFPETIFVTEDGLEQIAWFRRKKQIRWADIVEINTGERSRTITITAADGTKIVHSRQLPNRSRLLQELKKRCGDNLPVDFPREPLESF